MENNGNNGTDNNAPTSESSPDNNSSLFLSSSAGKTATTSTNTTTDLEAWLSKLSQGTPLSEPEVKSLCDLARDTFLQESNVQPVKAPVTVCGDIHGELKTNYDCIYSYRFFLKH